MNIIVNAQHIRYGEEQRIGFSYYHRLSHEVLGIYSGKATVQLGGDPGPKALLEKGDVLAIPAGVAHKNLDFENDIGVVGLPRQTRLRYEIWQTWRTAANGSNHR